MLRILFLDKNYEMEDNYLIYFQIINDGNN